MCENNCAICLETLDLTSADTELCAPICGHMLHKDCYNSMKTVRPFTCPTCRRVQRSSLTITNINLEKYLLKFRDCLDRCGLNHNIYQYNGMRWALANELNDNPPYNIRGGFIADEMGLGKTILMTGLMHTNETQTLIIVPPILLEQWSNQIYKMIGINPLIYYGTEKKHILLEDLKISNVVLTTYGSIINREKTPTPLHFVNWGRIIFDEAHHLRNKTTRNISACKLPGRIRWIVSGTPVQNSKKDFYNLCNVIRIPDKVYKNNVLFIASFILKRTKIEAGIHLPDLTVKTSIVNWQSNKEMELSKELHSVFDFSLVNTANSQLRNNISKIGLLMRAKQVCIFPKLMSKLVERLINERIISDSYREAINYSSKLDAVIESILLRKDNGCGKLVFCNFHEEIDEIQNRLHDKGFQNVATYDGRNIGVNKLDIFKQKFDVLILQIQTGCEGLNLQENYSDIYFISPHWNPAVEDQAIARCHRIGQTKTVYVERFIMAGFQQNSVTTYTIDQHIDNTQTFKRNISNEIIY